MHLTLNQPRLRSKISIAATSRVSFLSSSECKCCSECCGTRRPGSSFRQQCFNFCFKPQVKSSFRPTGVASNGKENLLRVHRKWHPFSTLLSGSPTDRSLGNLKMRARFVITSRAGAKKSGSNRVLPENPLGIHGDWFSEFCKANVQ